LGNLLYKTDDGKYALSSLGDAAVSMMKNVEEPSRTSMHIGSESIGRMSALKLLCLILVCGLVASLIFNGIILFRYNDLGSTNNELNKAYSDLTNQYNQLNQSYGELNRTYSDLKEAYNELNQTYFSHMPHTLAFQTIETYGASTDTPAYYVVQNESSLMEMWSNLTFWVLLFNSSEWTLFPPLPEVNFSESTVIAVFSGRSSTFGYGTKITEILDVGQFVIVKVEKIYPGSNCIWLMGSLYSNHVIKTDKIDKPILFYTTERTIDCG
jgi:hypothetical protein